MDPGFNKLWLLVCKEVTKKHNPQGEVNCFDLCLSVPCELISSIFKLKHKGIKPMQKSYNPDVISSKSQQVLQGQVLLSGLNNK